MKRVLSKINTPIKILIKLLLVFCLSAFIVYKLDDTLYNKEANYGKGYKSLPVNSLDYIVLGSSHAQYSFIPSVIYEKTGLYGYVLGSACQPLEVSYEMLKEACKTQSPKLVILEAYTALPLSDICMEDACYVIAENQMTGEEKINTINFLPEDKASQYYIDFLTYHNSWRNSDFLDTIRNPKSKMNETNYSFGYIEYNFKYNGEGNYWRPMYNPDDVYDVELREKDLESLNKIYDYCKANNIQLIMYKTPIDGMDDENYSYLQKEWQWAKEKGIEYIDFHKEAFDLDFYMVVHSSAFHSYVSGSCLISNFIGDRLNEYDLSFEHRENEFLNDLYNGDYQNVTINYLFTENDPIKYLNHLAYNKGIISFRYVVGENMPSEKFISEIKALGLKDFDGTKDTYAIIYDGEVLSCVEENTNIEATINGVNFVVGKEGIFTDGMLHNKEEINCNLVYYKNDMSIYADKNIDIQEYAIWDAYEYNYHRNW